MHHVGCMVYYYSSRDLEEMRLSIWAKKLGRVNSVVSREPRARTMSWSEPASLSPTTSI